jgi:hypothetical protein
MREPLAFANSSKLFVKFFANFCLFCQVFPRIPLAVLWDFKGLWALQTRFLVFQIFSLRPGLGGPVAICHLPFAICHLPFAFLGLNRQ